MAHRLRVQTSTSDKHMPVVGRSYLRPGGKLSTTPTHASASAGFIPSEREVIVLLVRATSVVIARLERTSGVAGACWPCHVAC